MTHFAQRLSEVAAYFNHGDQHLGYRRLLDAAIETGNFTVFEETLRFAHWYDHHEQEHEQVRTRVQDLLPLIGQGYRKQPTADDPVKLQARQVSKRYLNGHFSLAPLDVTLQEGQIVGLVGENGNGKTTLLRLLYGELKPDSGGVDYRFRETRSDRAAYAIKSAMAFVPQRPAAWYGSLRDNLQYAATYSGFTGRENELWTEMIIARMGLRPYRDYTWKQISSGYKMRFELARTLMRRPEVLLLDEPLANLDMLAQQIILEDLRYLATSESMPLSIILSSQQLYEVEKVSDEVIFLQKGVARYQRTTADDALQQTSPLVLELEVAASRAEIEQLLEPLGLQRLSFNGGVYILYFVPGADMAAALSAIGQARLPVKYLRDISISSRRFFDA